jgi:hypothetical protein
MRLAVVLLTAACVLPFTAEARGLHMSGVGSQSSGAGFSGGVSFDWRGFSGIVVPPDFDLPEEPFEPSVPAEEPPAADPTPIDVPPPPVADPPPADPVTLDPPADPPADPGQSGGVGDPGALETVPQPDQPAVPYEPSFAPEFEPPQPDSPWSVRGVATGRAALD